MSNVPSSHIATLPYDCSSSAVLPTTLICSLSPNFPNDCVVSRRQLPINLDGSTHSDASSKGKAPLHAFSRVVKLRVGGLSGSHICRTRSGHHIHLVSSNFERASQITPLPRPLPSEFDLPSMALFGTILFHLIRVKTKRNWTQIKGHVDYVDMGNWWIVFKFSTVHDWGYVWVKRPWLLVVLTWFCILGNPF